MLLMLFGIETMRPMGLSRTPAATSGRLTVPPSRRSVMTISTQESGLRTALSRVAADRGSAPNRMRSSGAWTAEISEDGPITGDVMAAGATVPMMVSSMPANPTRLEIRCSTTL